MRTFNQFLLVVLSLIISTSTFAQLTSQLRNSTLTFREDTLSKAQIRYNGVDFFLDNNEFNGNTYVESRNNIELRTGLTPTARLYVNEFGNIGMGTTTPNSSAILDINSTDKGILIPRVGNINAVSSTVEGLLIYDSSESNFKYHNGEEWVEFGGSGDNNEFGQNNYASNGSSALGRNNSATGGFSSALGQRNEAIGNFSTAVGRSNDALGSSSSAFGFGNNASGDFSSAFGFSLISDVYGMTVIGIYNETPVGSETSWVSTDPVFAIGNGQDGLTRSTALTILKNGNTGIGTTTPSDRLHIVGSSDGGSALRIVTGNISNLSDTKPGIFQRRLDGSFAGAMYADVEGETSEGADLTMQAEDDFRVYTNNNLANIRLYVGDGGSVGIGTDVPSQLLSVNGSAGKPGGGDWATFSDKRLKKNIQDFEDGLAQILQIRPVRFQYNGKANMPTDESYIGVVAQEMQRIAPYTIQAVAYETEEKSKVEYLTYDGTAVTYMLVNAIQEQQKMIKEKEERIVQLEAQMKELNTVKDRLAKIEALLQESEVYNTQNVALFTAKLEQNAPNPFNSETLISYTLPDNVQEAYLQISDQNGKVLKQIDLNEKGKGQVRLQANTLNAGTYFYSLIIDGQIIESKQMVLTK